MPFERMKVGNVKHSHKLRAVRKTECKVENCDAGNKPITIFEIKNTFPDGFTVH